MPSQVADQGADPTSPAASSASTPSPPPSPQARLLSKIKAGMAQAELGNAATAAPLSPVSTWVPGRAYVQGDVVRGQGVDASHQYICHDAVGPSAVSGAGPSGMGDGPISDGGVTWYYDREVRTAVVDALTPVVSWGLRADLLKGLPDFQTITPTLAEPVVFYSGGVVEQDPNMLTPVVTVRGSNYSTLAQPRYQYPSSAAMTFWTDSDQVVLGSFNAVYARQTLVLEVNDRLVDDSQFAVPPGMAPINPGGFLLDFSQGGSKGQTKKVRVLSSDGFAISAYQLFIEKNARIWSQANPNRWRMAVEGDSLTQGGYNTPYHAGLDWVSQIGRLLGCDDVANMAQGGTGFISNNVGRKTTYLQRVERLAALNADVYVIAGNHNDSSYPAQDQIDAVLKYFKKLRQLQPDALVVVMGDTPLQGESSLSGPLHDAEVNLKKAFDQWADDHAYFIPVATDPNGLWITGSGSVDHPKGDGNMDHYYISIDGHPLQRGVNYLAQRYAQALKRLFLSL
ncbi:MAG: SGNH/GDSL hydrolase family protein [Burkholderiales bacterium]|nr:SGNH/GDSL hydrolase family protein [Burkholderiales bacterium]